MARYQPFDMIYDKLNTVNCSVLLGNVVIQPATAVRYLGVQLDSKLSLKHHVNKIVSSCY